MPPGGSSPQVRGTSPRPIQGAVWEGIIPAGAGHFNSPFACVSRVGDHPRRCGALEACLAVSSRRLGSSPQVRGTSMDRHPPRPRRRIIPAGAGHFAPGFILWKILPDHPRRCGALFRIFAPQYGGRGSSPQVRGTSNQYPAAGIHRGIIPAGAGHFSGSQ